MSIELALSLSSQNNSQECSDDDRLAVVNDHDRRLPPEFRHLPATLLSQCRLTRLSDKATANKSVLFKVFAEDLDYLDEKHAEIDGLVENVLRENVIVPQAKTEASRAEMVKRVVTQTNARIAHLPKFKRPSLNMNIAEAPAAQIWRGMMMTEAVAAKDLVTNLAQRLESMVGVEAIGLVSWSHDDPSVCEVYYFTEVLSEQKVGEKRNTRTQTTSSINGDWINTTRTTRTTIEHCFEVEQLHEERVHLLIGAHVHRLPAQGLFLPKRVERLVRAVPHWLRPELQIVTGDQVNELKLSSQAEVYRHTKTDVQVSKSERQTFAPQLSISGSSYTRDPVLLLGPYVLSGWSESNSTYEDKSTSGSEAVVIFLVRAISSLREIANLLRQKSEAPDQTVQTQLSLFRKALLYEEAIDRFDLKLRAVADNKLQDYRLDEACLEVNRFLAANPAEP